MIENFCRMAHAGGMYRLFPVALLLLCGCDGPRSESASKPTNQPAVPLNTPSHLNHAQPKLRTMKLWLGPKEITAELAVTETQVATGMMFRKQMEETEGMLFIFGRPHRASFYMRNTYVPLSLAYVDSEGAILEIYDAKPLDETPIFARSEQVQYVLEVKQGWFDRNGVRVGTVIRTEHGSLPETFFRRANDNL